MARHVRRVTRRAFIRLATVAAAGADALLAACATPGTRARAATGPAGTSGAAGAAPAAAPTTAGAIPLEEATLEGLEAAMAAGHVTSEQLVEAYLARIATLDPRLNAIIAVSPTAKADARARDAERRAGKALGPLHGIPVILKDNLDTVAPLATTAGSLALAGLTRAEDAHAVAKLRDAGAVILAKANLSEWANFRSTHSSSGWSGTGGQGRNPYVLDRSPCGSSSGPAQAMAANLGAVSLGTETDGSIVCPSAMCGVVGLKPTVGRVSRHGVVPISHSQDTAGPITRTVADAARVLAAIEGPDPADPATKDAGKHTLPPLAGLLDPSALKGARLGVPRKSFWGYSPHADAVCEAALKVLVKQGAVLVDPADLPEAKALSAGDAENEVLLYEFHHDLDAYLGALPPSAPVHSLEGLIAWNTAHATEELPFFGQELFEEAVKKGPLTEPAYQKALAECHRLARTQGIDAVMDAHRLDALVMPTLDPAWVIDLVCGDHIGGAGSTPAAVAGYPSITVPAGEAFGLPVGLLFTGRAWSEPTLIRLAHAFEQATRARRRPGFKPTLDLG